jgi:hypothetical protein
MIITTKTDDPPSKLTKKFYLWTHYKDHVVFVKDDNRHLATDLQAQQRIEIVDFMNYLSQSF